MGCIAKQMDKREPLAPLTLIWKTHVSDGIHRGSLPPETRTHLTNNLTGII